MEDVTFLQECGITIDSRWLAEMLCEQAPEEVSNYLKSLMRIADTLGLPAPLAMRLKILISQK